MIENFMQYVERSKQHAKRKRKFLVSDYFVPFCYTIGLQKDYRNSKHCQSQFCIIGNNYISTATVPFFTVVTMRGSEEEITESVRIV